MMESNSFACCGPSDMQHTVCCEAPFLALLKLSGHAKWQKGLPNSQYKFKNLKTKKTKKPKKLYLYLFYF